LNPETLADRARRSLQSGKRDRRVLRVEEPLHRGAACLHPTSKLRLTDVRALHLLRDLMGDHALYGNRLGLVEKILLPEKAIEITSNMLPIHTITPS
jgi:hypothetical protein